MDYRHLAVALLVSCLLLPAGSMAADSIVLVAPPSSGFFSLPGRNPTVTAGHGGYGVTWMDRRVDLWNGDVRFRLLDASGSPAGPEIISEIDPLFFHYGYHLSPVSGGWIHLVQDSSAYLYSQSLTPIGEPRNAVETIIDSIELYPVAMGRGASGPVIAFVEWDGSWGAFTQKLDKDGLLKGPRRRLTFKAMDPDIVGGNYIDDIAIDSGPGGFITAWVEWGAGLQVKHLRSSGTPYGEAVTAHAMPECFGDYDVVTDGRTDIVVYGAGCNDTDLFLRFRQDGGPFTDPIVLAAGPFNEGDHDSDVLHTVQVVLSEGRIGVLYLLADSPGPPYFRWRFAEFTLEGTPIGAVRDLYEEFGVDPLWDDVSDVTLAGDAERGRYLFAWAGQGPEGWGTYLLMMDEQP